MHDVYKLKKMLCEELEAFGKKNEIDVNELDIIDKLAHSIKNICKVIEDYEEEEDYSEADRRMRDRGMYYDDRYTRNDGMSYARDGRGGNRGGSRGGMRGGRGGYSRMGGYSMADESMKDMIDEMKDLMDDMPEEKRREMQKFVTKMEQM